MSVRIFQRGNTYWLDIRTLDGRRLRESAKTSNEELARARGKLREKQENSPIYSKETGSITLRDAVERTLVEYFSGLKSRDVVQTTLRKTVRILGPDMDILTVSDREFKQLASELKREGAKPATINRYFAGLNRVLQHCKANYDLPVGPVRGMYEREGNGRIRVITRPEQEAIFSYFGKVKNLKENWTNEDLVDILTVFFSTGMRRGELFAFRVNQFHGDRIEFQPDQHKGNGVKSVVLNQTATKALQGRIERLSLPIGARVFPYSKDAFTRLWLTMRKHLGLEHDTEFVPHAIRHTFASRLAEKGASIYDVSKLLGHSSVKTTERYAHLFIDRLQSVVNVLD